MEAILVLAPMGKIHVTMVVGGNNSLQDLVGLSLLTARERLEEKGYYIATKKTVDKNMKHVPELLLFGPYQGYAFLAP